MPTVIQRSVPGDCYAIYPNRPVRGIVLHHTATSLNVQCKRGASWHRLFSPDGIIFEDVSEAHAAHHCGATDRWRPSWILNSPNGFVSAANYCTLGYEITYAPQSPTYQVPTDEQYESIRWQLTQDYARYGPLPIVGHGDVDRSKWPTEPHLFDYTRVGIGPMTPLGRFFTPPEEEYEVPATDEEIKAYLETYGIEVNMAFAIPQRAALAYRRGETRGPAVSQEYDWTEPDGTPRVRQDFSAGTASYDPATGGVSWAEVNLERKH